MTDNESRRFYMNRLATMLAHPYLGETEMDESDPKAIERYRTYIDAFNSRYGLEPDEYSVITSLLETGRPNQQTTDPLRSEYNALSKLTSDQGRDILNLLYIEDIKRDLEMGNLEIGIKRLSALVDYLKGLGAINAEYTEGEYERLSEILNRPIDYLELNSRTYSFLRNANILKLGDLVQRTEEELSKYVNCSKWRLRDIKDGLSILDLSLGMKLPKRYIEETHRELINKSIDDLFLGVRAHNGLKNANIRTVGELLQLSESELLKIHGIGNVTYRGIKDVLSKLGLPLRMNKTEEILSKSVEDLELSIRSMNCLKNSGIKTVGELVRKTEAELLRTKNFGRKSLKELGEELSKMGLSLGMKFPEEYKPS